MGYIFQFQYEDESGLRTIGSLRDEQVLGSDGKLHIPKIYETVLVNIEGEKRGFVVKSKRTVAQGRNVLVNFVVTDIPGKDTNEYMLGCHLKPEPKHHEFKLIRPITSADMDIIDISMKKLGDFGNCCTLSEICDKNYQTILSYHVAIKDDFPLNRHRDHEYMEEAFQEMNRLLLNYLSSFKTFIDHLTTRYTRLQRQGHSFLDDFKKLTAACYDGNFSYRFFSKLRDYVQHCGLPLGSIDISEYPDQKGEVVIKVSITIDRDNLISSYKKWGNVRSDLQSQPRNMELLPYLAGFQSQIQLISLVVSAFEISLATDPWHIIDKLMRETQDKHPNGRPFIGRYEEHGGQRKLHVIEFPFHTMVKFQETIDKVQDFQNRQKMQGRAAT
jgi:hypothetical protein